MHLTIRSHAYKWCYLCIYVLYVHILSIYLSNYPYHIHIYEPTFKNWKIAYKNFRFAVSFEKIRRSDITGLHPNGNCPLVTIGAHNPTASWILHLPRTSRLVFVPFAVCTPTPPDPIQQILWQELFRKAEVGIYFQWGASFVYHLVG